MDYQETLMRGDEVRSSSSLALLSTTLGEEEEVCGKNGHRVCLLQRRAAWTLIGGSYDRRGCVGHVSMEDD